MNAGGGSEAGASEGDLAFFFLQEDIIRLLLH
jgi:uncharacterized spore protein YtfJ